MISVIIPVYNVRKYLSEQVKARLLAKNGELKVSVGDPLLAVGENRHWAVSAGR